MDFQIEYVRFSVPVSINMLKVILGFGSLHCRLVEQKKRGKQFYGIQIYKNTDVCFVIANAKTKLIDTLDGEMILAIYLEKQSSNCLKKAYVNFQEKQLPLRSIPNQTSYSRGMLFLN